MWNGLCSSSLFPFQGLHLELERQQEEDLPLQPPYYDLGVSPTYRPLVRMAKTLGSAATQLPQNPGPLERKVRQKSDWLGWGHSSIGEVLAQNT